jgi:hypothetical protein
MRQMNLATTISCSVVFLAVLQQSVALGQYDPHGMPLDPNAYLASYQATGQPPATGAASGTSDPSTARVESGRSLARNVRTRAGRAPNMFGDSLPAIGHALFGPISPDTYAPTGLAGGGRYSSIGENNKAFTMDRVYFTYQYFHNAAPVSLSGGPFVNYGISQYLIGGEKTFFDELASVEIRGSMVSDIDAFGPDTAFDTGTVGNVTANFKLQLYETEDLGIVGGLGVGVPVGTDFQGYILGTGTNFTLDNQATYLLPFLGATYAPGDLLFGSTFVQVATAANGDHFLVNGAPVDHLNPQTTMHVSTSLGAWLLDEDDGLQVQGVAWLNELHYTTALQDPDFIDVLGPFSEPISLATSPGRYNILNMTSGIHVQVNDQTSLRICAVFPIRRSADRTFDGEVMATLNQEF